MAPVVLADVFPEVAAAADYLREHGVLPPDLQLGPLPAAAQAIKNKVSRRRSVPLAALLACMRVHLRCATQLPYAPPPDASTPSKRRHVRCRSSKI